MGCGASSARSNAPQNRDLDETVFCGDPGSAVHRADGVERASTRKRRAVLHPGQEFRIYESAGLDAKRAQASGCSARTSCAPAWRGFSAEASSRKCASTNRRIAEDRFPCCRAPSMAATISDRVIPREPAISFNAFQKASSRLTLVL